MSSQQGDELDLASALCSQLRSTAAHSVSAAVQYLADDGPADAAVEAARHWIATAELWEDAFSLLALQFGTPGDPPWLDRIVTTEFADLLESTASAARAGAGNIRRVRQSLAVAIDAARQSIPEAG